MHLNLFSDSFCYVCMFFYVYAHSFINFHCLHDKASDLGEANPVYLVSLSWTLYYIKSNKSGVNKKMI